MCGLKNGGTATSRAAFLNVGCSSSMSKSLDLHEELSPDLLVALAFIDDDEPQNPSGRFDDISSKHKPDEYFARAKKVLVKHPELTQVGNLIEKAMGQMDPPGDS
jgi:hypothetical protein